jgi:hypothetical protein
MGTVKYPEQLAARKEKRARQFEEGVLAMADYRRKQQQAKDQLRRLREARLARDRTKET